MQLLIERDAARRLRDLPQKRQLKMLEALEAIADNPYGEHANVKPLKGYANTFRYRLGDWRAVHVVDAAEQEVRVTPDRSARRGVRMRIIKPIAETADSVTLRRDDFEALMDAADGEHARGIEAAAKRGQTEYLPAALVKRMAKGESPVTVWRAHRGLKQNALAEAAGISKTYLSEIEAGKKPGSVSAMAAIARALRVGIEDLV